MGLVGKASYEVGEGLTGTVAQREETMIVSDFNKEPNWRNKYSELPPRQATTWIGAPILKNGKIAGVIRLTDKIPAIPSSVRFTQDSVRFTQDSMRFTQDDAELLELICAYIAAWP
jgi:GAF domain-containing protein